MSINPNQLVIATQHPKEATSKLLRDAFLRTCDATGWIPDGEVILSFVTEAKMIELNREYAHNDYSTDVLSFSYTEEQSQKIPNQDEHEGAVEGEIVICTAFAERYALEHKTDLAAELVLLLVHGLLHLSGRDHQSITQQTSMQQVQDDIVRSLRLTPHSMLW